MDDDQYLLLGRVKMKNYQDESKSINPLDLLKEGGKMGFIMTDIKCRDDNYHHHPEVA